MRQWPWIALLALGIVVGSCASAHEPPKTADLIFPIPWLLKKQSAGTLHQSFPPSGQEPPVPGSSVTSGPSK